MRLVCLTVTSKCVCLLPFHLESIPALAVCSATRCIHVVCWDAKASSAFVWNEKTRILPSTAKIWSWLGKTTPVCIRRISQDPPRTVSEQPSTWAPPPATVVPNSASESMGSEPCDRTPADALHLQRSTQRPGFLVGGPCQR